MFEQLSKRRRKRKQNQSGIGGDGDGGVDGGGMQTCGMACGRIAGKLQFVQIFMYIENYSFV